MSATFDVYNSVEGIQITDSAEGTGSSDAVSFDKLTELSGDRAPDARSLVTPLGQRDIPSSETVVLRSVLKKPSAKLCLESLQVSTELHVPKQTE